MITVNNICHRFHEERGPFQQGPDEHFPVFPSAPVYDTDDDHGFDESHDTGKFYFPGARLLGLIIF